VRAAAGALTADALFVLLFATIGRVSHAEGVTLGGVVHVAWPFLVALLVGWAVARRRTGWPTGMTGSTLVWLTTAALGLVLRVLTGGGFAWSFGLVTLLVLGLFLVGWRCSVEVVRFAIDGFSHWAEKTAARR
jgi:hypothetical protein